MKALIIATNETPEGVKEEIRTGQSHRIDYLELSERLGAPYMDYNTVTPYRPGRWIEEALRMDYHQARQVAQRVRREGYDTVFSMSERVGIPLALMLNRRVRHVVQIAHPLSPPKLLLIKALGISGRWAHIIVPTRAEGAALQKAFHLPAERIGVIHYPVDTCFFHPLGDYRDDEPAHIESLGLSYRDYPTLIRAMHSLPHIVCYLRAGSTWVHFRAGYEGLEIPPNVRIQPFVHPSVLRNTYSSARFIVVPIRHTTQWSAGCTTVTQALAMGRAVVSTCNPGMGDYLWDGQVGLLTETGNPTALAEAIEHLWSHPHLVAEMGQRAPDWVQENFSLDAWLETIQPILAG